MPQLTINLNKLHHNAEKLQSMLNKRNISLIAVTKVVSGDLNVALTLTKAGVKYIGDSRIRNIQRMAEEGIEAEFVLIRVPSIQEIPDVVAYADYSVNSELKTLKILSKEAIQQNKIHRIILMVDMGDIREGIHPNQIDRYVEEISKLQNIILKGIATNLKCFGGVIPDQKNMQQLSQLAERIEIEHGIKLDFISGGNSANFQWLIKSEDIGLINNLRIGEALFFGRETIDFKRVKPLYTDIFTLSVPIVEIKNRSLMPVGKIHSNAFGEKVTGDNGIFARNPETEKNHRTQILLNIGRQDVDIDGLIPIESVQILGASSDYLIATPKNSEKYVVGQNLHFKLNYAALMRLMVSPFVEKKYIEKREIIVLEH